MCLFLCQYHGVFIIIAVAQVETGDSDTSYSLIILFSIA